MTPSNLPPSPSDPDRRGPNPGVRRTLAGIHRLRVQGQGRIVLHLKGTGRVNLRRGRYDDFCFEGRGIPKYLSAEQVHLDRVEGTLTLEGMELSLEFRGGRADAEIVGTFEVDERAA